MLRHRLGTRGDIRQCSHIVSTLYATDSGDKGRGVRGTPTSSFGTEVAAIQAYVTVNERRCSQAWSPAAGFLVSGAQRELPSRLSPSQLSVAKRYDHTHENAWRMHSSKRGTFLSEAIITRAGVRSVALRG